jgi:hypothetical protein
MVAGIILALFLGAQIVNALIPVRGIGPGVPGPGTGPGPVPSSGPGTGPAAPLPPGSFVTVGPLRIPIETGWVPQDVPGSNIITRLTKSNVALDLFSASIQGQADAVAVYNEYMSALQQDATGFAATQPNLTQIGSGVLAARGSYTGAFGGRPVEGEITAFTSSATQGWIFDAWADAGALRQLLPEAERMIDNLQVSPQ